MTNRKLEQQIRTAVEHIAPDRLDSILSSCEQDNQAGFGSSDEKASKPQKKGNVIRMSEKTNKRKKTGLAALAAAAAFALCVGGLGLMNRNKTAPVDSVILLDVNPSLSLSVDEQERVLAAEALNEDAAEVLGDMELEGVSLEVAVNAIIGSMLQKGYLGDAQNSVLVSVESQDAARSERLEQKVSQAISDAMQEGALDAAVLSQTVSADDTALAELAEKYGISLGKAALIQEVIQQDPTLTFEALAPMTVNDITLITSSKNIDCHSVTQTGAASDRAYISQEEAVNRGCADAGIAAADITRLEVEFDSEDGIMVYEVEFETGTAKYEYDLNARTGEILKSEKKEKNIQKTGQEQKENTAGTAETSSDNSNTSYIGESAALTAALNHAGVTEAALTEKKVKLDKDDGRMIYEIEFKADRIEYEYKIDAVSGEIVKAEKEADH